MCRVALATYSHAQTYMYILHTPPPRQTDRQTDRQTERERWGRKEEVWREREGERKHWIHFILLGGVEESKVVLPRVTGSFGRAQRGNCITNVCVCTYNESEFT